MVQVIKLNGSDHLFISGNVPSLKNGKIKTERGIFSSKTVKNYLKNLGIQTYSSSRKTVKGYVTRPNEFEKSREFFQKYLTEKPYKVGFHFVRKSRHSFDFNNANQLVADLMVAHDFIDDDDMDNFLPYPLELNGSAYTYDKLNPGVYIRILN